MKLYKIFLRRMWILLTSVKAIFSREQGCSRGGTERIWIVPVKDNALPGEFVNVRCRRLMVPLGIAEIRVPLSKDGSITPSRTVSVAKTQLRG